MSPDPSAIRLRLWWALNFKNCTPVCAARSWWQPHREKPPVKQTWQAMTVAAAADEYFITYLLSNSKHPSAVSLAAYLRSFKNKPGVLTCLNISGWMFVLSLFRRQCFSSFRLLRSQTDVNSTLHSSEKFVVLICSEILYDMFSLPLCQRSVPSLRSASK